MKDNYSVVFSSISDLRWFTRSNVSGVDSVAVEEKYVCAVAEEEVEMAEAECNELAGLEVEVAI